MENKKTHGGKREGAGRKKIAPELKKKTVRKGKVIYFRISDDDYILLENIAKENNLSTMQYAKEILLDTINQNKTTEE